MFCHVTVELENAGRNTSASHFFSSFGSFTFWCGVNTKLPPEVLVFCTNPWENGCMHSALCAVYTTLPSGIRAEWGKCLRGIGTTHLHLNLLLFFFEFSQVPSPSITHKRIWEFFWLLRKLLWQHMFFSALFWIFQVLLLIGKFKLSKISHFHHKIPRENQGTCKLLSLLNNFFLQ